MKPPTDPYKDAPEGYKHPNDRAHFWEYSIPHLAPKEPLSPDWPRHLHKLNQKPLVVLNQTEMDAATKDGWQLEPVSQAVAPVPDYPSQVQ